MPKLIALAAAVMLALAAPAQSAPAGAPQMPVDAPTRSSPMQNTGVRPKLLHVYATPDGESHIEVLEVAANAGPLPLANLVAISYSPTNVDWHTAPQPQFAINLTGRLRVELSDGGTHDIGPGDLVYLSDTTGKGHITRLIEPVTALFLRTQPGFDIRKWVKGEMAAAPADG